MKLNQFGDTVRLAILGLGCRGVGQMKVLLDMPDVQIAAVCDAYADRVETAREIVREAKGNVPFGSTDPIECIRRDDVDAVVVMTGWETHIPPPLSTNAGSWFMPARRRASPSCCWRTAATARPS